MLPSPFGKVGSEVTLDQDYDLAHKGALSMLGSVKRERSDLDRLVGWVRVLAHDECRARLRPTPRCY